MKQYYVYFMSNEGRTLYIGMTNNLERRVFEHKQEQVPGFTSKYSLTRLVYYESTGDVREALAREKQLKGGLRRKKIALMETQKREGKDLSASWYAPPENGGKESDSSLRSE